MKVFVKYLNLKGIRPRFWEHYDPTPRYSLNVFVFLSYCCVIITLIKCLKVSWASQDSQRPVRVGIMMIMLFAERLTLKHWILSSLVGKGAWRPSLIWAAVATSIILSNSSTDTNPSRSVSAAWPNMLKIIFSNSCNCSSELWMPGHPQTFPTVSNWLHFTVSPFLSNDWKWLEQPGNTWLGTSKAFGELRCLLLRPPSNSINLIFTFYHR